MVAAIVAAEIVISLVQSAPDAVIVRRVLLWGALGALLAVATHDLRDRIRRSHEATARLQEQVGELIVVKDRVRLAADLQSSVVQRIFAAGLSLQSVLAMATQAEMLGYRVDTAKNGAEAVRLAAAKSYQAILMDCQMPAMDGYTATAKVRHQERPGQHIPIIAMTAGALTEDRQRCLDAGMDDYLAKPIDLQQLHAVLIRWITATSSTSPAGSDSV